MGDILMRMATALQRAARENDFVRHTLFSAVLFAALAFLLHWSLHRVVFIYALALALEAFDVVGNAYDVPHAVRGMLIGAFGVACGVLGLLLETGVLAGHGLGGGANKADPTGVAVFVVFGLAALWILVDSTQQYRHREETADSDSSAIADYVDADGVVESTSRMQFLGRVRIELTDGPATPAEVAVELDVVEARAARALDVLEERGFVREEDGRYYPSDDRETGLRPALARVARWLPRRIARPFGEW